MAVASFGSTAASTGRAENETVKLRNGMCCGNGWIGTTNGSTVGMWSPKEMDRRIGPSFVLAGFAMIWTSSVLVAMLSSMTSFLATAFSSICMAWSALTTWAFAHPMTSAVFSMAIFMVLCSTMTRNKKNKIRSRSHLGPGQVRRRWQSGVRQKWDVKFRMKGLLFMMLYVEAMGMDAQQANDLLSRIMELSNAATQAASSAMSSSSRAKELQQGLEMV